MKDKVIDFRFNLKLFWGLVRKYKPSLAIVLLLTIILEAAFLADSYLIKIIVDGGADLSAKIITSAEFIDIGWFVLSVYFVLVAIRAVAMWARIHVNNRFEMAVLTDLKRKFFNHIISLSHRFHTSTKTGSLISRLTRGAGAVGTMNHVFIWNFAATFFKLVLIVGALWYFSASSALVVLITTTTFVCYSLFIQEIHKEADIKARDAEDTEIANIADIFMNVDSVKYFGKEGIVRRVYQKLSEKTKWAQIRDDDYWRYLDVGQTLIIGLGIVSAIYFPFMDFAKGLITIGTLTFIYTVFLNIIGNLYGIVFAIKDFYRGMARFENLFQYAKEENEILELPNAKKLRVRDGTIEFNDMYFSYNKRKIFTNFNLKIPKNKKVAFVGHSGSGKSTLMKLLFRLHDVDKGEILIDGKDIRSYKKESLRSSLSIVPQECMLFDTTIYYNVAFARPKASKSDVMKAIKFAQLDKVIKNFPKQERTIVGERGVKLSGGEKQRVSIARALLADKKILVLDEATSALDSETEHEIQKDLAKLMKGRTSIIIAHRLSTIMKADIIVVLKEGKIVQMGSHKQLIKKKGEYKKLWNLQKGGYIK